MCIRDRGADHRLTWHSKSGYDTRPEEAMQDKSTLEDTLALMRDLRARCEWDANQTHDSLRPYLIEEAHELDEAIRDRDDRQMREELGDVLLQVLFHSVVAEERGAFDIGDVAHGLITKMQRRHPHLYDGGERQPWEQMKARKRSSIEEGLSLIHISEPTRLLSIS